jgi:hypothetical protein
MPGQAALAGQPPPLISHTTHSESDAMTSRPSASAPGE